MYRMLLKSKIHRAVVTDANLQYDGSIGIDTYLLEQAGLVAYEKVHVVNINNGARFETYVICEDAHSGKVCLNGAAARLAEIGDKVIIMAYGLVPENEIPAPRVVLVDTQNTVKTVK